MKEKIIIKIGEDMEKYCTDSTLPAFLRETISAFLIGKEKHESGIGYTEFDMYLRLSLPSVWAKICF